MRLAAGDEILVPAYICSVVTDAIEAAGVSPRFYEVNADCSLSLDAIESEINSNTRAILAVRFFGLPTDMTKLRSLCEKEDLYLIEDCAHSLGGVDPSTRTEIGSTGDIAIFSWRKSLAINDGASLVVNSPELDIRPELASPNLKLNLRAAKSLVDQAFKSGWAPRLRGLVESIRKRTRRERCASSSIDQPVGIVKSDAFDNRMLEYPTSRISNFLLKRSLISRIGNARLQHYRSLVKGLSPMEAFHPLAASLPDGASPWVLALRVNGLINAHQEFRKRGIPASHWGDVRPPAIDASSYPIADDLFRNLVFLPVHQDLEPEHLELILSVAAEVAQIAAPRCD